MLYLEYIILRMGRGPAWRLWLEEPPGLGVAGWVR